MNTTCNLHITKACPYKRNKTHYMPKKIHTPAYQTTYKRNNTCTHTTHNTLLHYNKTTYTYEHENPHHAKENTRICIHIYKVHTY